MSFETASGGTLRLTAVEDGYEIELAGPTGEVISTTRWPHELAMDLVTELAKS